MTTSLAFADLMEILKMTTRQTTHGNPNKRRKKAKANLDVRIVQGSQWWIDRGCSPEDADVKHRLAQSEASTLEERIK